VGVSAFNELWEAAQKGKVYLVENGMMLFNVRKADNVAVIYAIVVSPEEQRKGVGSALLARLIEEKRPAAVEAKCPSDLESNGWYRRMGFTKIGVEKSSKEGRPDVNKWRKEL
jgi:ribosomal protein S18 acetylase RimI-like enzyme